MFAYFFGSPANDNSTNPYRHPPTSEVNRPKKKKKKSNNSNKAKQRKTREEMDIDVDIHTHSHSGKATAAAVSVGIAVDPLLSEDEEEDEIFTHTHEAAKDPSAEQGAVTVRLGQMDALVAQLAERHELVEVQRCIDWMWQRGLRYDLEEDVERELALKNYEREEALEEEEANNSTAAAEEDAVKNNELVNDEPAVHLEEQPVPEETPVEIVLERLRIVGSYASVNLYDCLVALCSWVSLQKNTLPDCERLFFQSEVLTDILHALFLRHGLWAETPEVREALHSLFRELFGARKSVQAMAALEGALQRVDGEARPTDMEARALARALSLCLFSFWENAKETSPDALKDLFARFESVSHDVVPSKLLKDSREAQSVLLQQQTLRGLIPELLSKTLSSSQRSALSADELIARQTEVLQATLRDLLSSTTGGEDDKNSDAEQPISHDHLLAAEAALLKKKIEDAQNHREQLLVQVRLIDLEMADLQRQMGAVSRKLAAAEHAQKSSSSSSSSASNASAVPALQQQLNRVLEQFSRELFVVAKDEPTLSSEQNRVLRGLQSFLQDTALGVIYCADVVFAFRQKIQGFAAQRAVYESLHMQKVLTQMDREESSLNEHIQTLLGFIDSSVTNVVGALSFLSHELAEPLKDLVSSQPLVDMFVRLRALECAVPELLRSHVWTEHAWRNAQTAEYNPQAPTDISGDSKAVQTKAADKKRVNSKNPRDSKKKGEKKESEKKTSVDTLSAIADLEKRTASKK